MGSVIGAEHEKLEVASTNGQLYICLPYIWVKSVIRLTQLVPSIKHVLAFPSSRAATYSCKSEKWD